MSKEKITSLDKIDFIKILRYAIYIIAIFSFFYISVFRYFFNIQKTNNIELIVKEKQLSANSINFILESINQDIKDDLLVIKDSSEFNNFINLNTIDTKNELEQLFYRIAKNKKSFDQIRFIDSNGIEIIRINNYIDDIEIVEKDKLQNKAQRYYFLETKKLKNNQYYFSPIDLNVENGEIEIPYKPIIRIGTPIYNSNNEFLGILIINYLADNLLSVVEKQINADKYDFVSSYLVNDDGYFIYNEDNDKTFSFMFDDKSYNIKNDSKLFEQNKKSNLIYYFEGDYIFSITELNPTFNIDTIEKESWYIVSSINVNDLPIVKERFLLNLSLIEFIILILIDIILSYLVFVLYVRTKDREQLTLTNKIANVTNDGVLICDRNKNIIFVNNAYEKISGYSFEDLSKNKYNLFNLELHSESFYKNIWDTVDAKSFWKGEIWIKNKDGLLYLKQLKIYSIKDHFNRNVEKYIAIYSDLSTNSEIKNNKKNVDYNLITNIPNEEILFKLLDLNISKAKNLFTLFCFSIVNYDELLYNSNLYEMNKTISRFIKSIQIYISKDDVFAQITNNSFVLVFLSFKTKEEIDSYLSNFFKFIRNKESNDLIVRGGIAIYGESDKNSKSLLNSANIAINQAVNTNQDYVISTEELKLKVRKRIQMELLLRKAIKNNELSIHYQPQINSYKNQIIGVEALLRWNNPIIGEISPYIFIPIAEKTNFIIELGYWVIEKVFSDYTKMKDIIPSSFKIAINISAVQFNDDNLINKIIELSNKYNVCLTSFELEITESVVVSNINKVNNKLYQFRQLGFSISMDDFGTGFSSLNYLKEMLIDKIKIDRSFIKDFPQKDDGAIVKIIVNISKELNLQLICEGVETEEQLNYIQKIGCCCVQGYYYSKPIPFNQLLEFIKNY